MNALGIPDELLSRIVALLSNNAQVKKAIVFGSRAKGNYKQHSDIDIAIVGGDDLLFCEGISGELSQLPTLLKFDVIAYETIQNAELKEHIDRVGVVIFDALSTRLTENTAEGRSER